MLRVKVFNPTGIKLPEKATPKSSAKDIRANLDLVQEKYCFNAKIVFVKKDMKTGTEAVYDHMSNQDEEYCVKALLISPGGRVLVPSGLIMELPANYHMDIRPRSGLALKYGLEVVNAPGLIDEDYRGDIGVILKNSGTAGLIIVDEERVAQIQLALDNEFAWDNVDSADDLSDTSRKDGGFNSTGTK
jgi:deoxyuridine 5'-triphosphate nucleotidohydrolase